MSNIYRQLYWKDKNKEKEAGNGPFLKKEKSCLEGHTILKRKNDGKTGNVIATKVPKAGGDEHMRQLQQQEQPGAQA